MRNYFWVVEESLDGGKSWFPLFGEQDCCTRTKKEALSWIAWEKNYYPIVYQTVSDCEIETERPRWRVVRYKREEK